jgi:gluconolactonase
MRHQALDPAFHALLDVGAQPKSIGSGFMFTEGPVWHPAEHYLLFSDIPASIRYRWDEAGGVREYVNPSHKGNGMTRDREGNLVVCEHATSSVVRFDGGGAREVLATHFEDRELNSPNDVIVAADGAILFSDPTYGRMPVYGVERPTVMGFQGVYRIPPGGGALELLVPRGMFGQPNGLCFSPDEKLLYVNDTEQANIRLFEVQGGKLNFVRIFASDISDPAKPGAPDGMKCDALGNVWVTGPGGIWVYAPDGRLLGKIAVPEGVANFHWGAKDWRTLFITATTSLYSLDVKIGPRIESFMR